MAKINKEDLLTQEYVKSIFDYHPDGYLVWKIEKYYRGKPLLNKKAGWVIKTHSGLRDCVRLHGISFYTSRVIFYYHNGWWPEMIDHKDRDTLNNRIENLRAADGFQNAKNVKKKSGTSSKYLGVHLSANKKTKKLKTTGELKTWVSYRWAAQININGKRKCIGRYKNEVDAARAYNEASIKHYGEFANLNVIT